LIALNRKAYEIQGNLFMPYVSRNPEGKIEALFDCPSPDAKEKIALDNAELIEFLSRDGLKEYDKHLLEESDRSIIRVVDDLIEALLKKRLLMITDLPLPAQEKLQNRQEARANLHTLDNPILHKENDPI
jgi:hypothetical protein